MSGMLHRHSDSRAARVVVESIKRERDGFKKKEKARDTGRYVLGDESKVEKRDVTIFGIVRSCCIKTNHVDGPSLREGLGHQRSFPYQTMFTG